MREQHRPRRDALRAAGRAARTRARRALRRAATSATSRSPCCSATTSSTRGIRCSPQMIDVRRAHGGSVVALHGGAARADPPVRLRRRRADPDGATTSSASPTWSRSRRTDEAPSNLAIIGRYVLDPRVFDVAARSTEPGRGGEIQLTDALRTLAHDVPRDDGGGVHRRRLPRPSLRHRRPALLPQGRRAARLRARRPRPGPRGVAQGVRGHALTERELSRRRSRRSSGRR